MSITTKPELLTPTNCQLIFIDHQPQMAFGVQSIDRQVLKNNTVALAKAAKVFNIPVTITTVETESFSGHTYPELLGVFPDQPILERTSMNSWDDQKVRDSLAKNGQKKVIVSGLWTEVCNNSFAFSAMAEGGYEIFMVADASGGTTQGSARLLMLRMIQAGVAPVTWQQVMLEWQRDWAHRDTYDAVMNIVREHSGAYGMGVDYAYTMVHKAPERVKHGTRLDPVAAHKWPPSNRRSLFLPVARGFAMKAYVITLAVGLLVGVLYGLLNVRSPAPPVIALIGLLGILIGEQIPPLAKRLLGGQAVTVSAIREHCGEHVFGRLPTGQLLRQRDARPQPSRRPQHDRSQPPRYHHRRHSARPHSLDEDSRHGPDRHSRPDPDQRQVHHARPVEPRSPGGGDHRRPLLRRGRRGRHHGAQRDRERR